MNISRNGLVGLLSLWDKIPGLSPFLCKVSSCDSLCTLDKECIYHATDKRKVFVPHGRQHHFSK